MSVFEASDIVEFAIRIEENGANFYRFAVQIAKDESTKKLFEQLADAEVHHKKTFEKSLPLWTRSPRRRVMMENMPPISKTMWTMPSSSKRKPSIRS